MKKFKYIILGSGIAGYGALEELLKETKDICVISKEGPCFLRPLLSKTTFSSYNIHVTYLPDIYDSITFIREEVTSIDMENKCINGKYTYETCIYALGAENRKLNMENAYYLRHVEDFYRIKRELPFISEIGIVGGGMIGLEVADLLSKMHKKVNVYEYMDWLIPRYFSKEDSEYLVHLLEKKGIMVQCHARKDSYEEKVVLVSIGNTKNNLFERAIVVDEYMKFTEDVFACGDCVEGNFMLWHEAYQQGRIAGQNALGKMVCFERKGYPVLFHLGKVGVCACETKLEGNVQKIIHESLFSINDSAEETYISIHDHKLVVIGDLRYVDWIQKGECII
ncbi:MAG: NAD(P)/FAD-dependent oxidoreductase [Bacillota bacterium]|nr:NAD(P)/FAD-dependent oxidoreductase [Bacillota bacterium]